MKNINTNTKTELENYNRRILKLINMENIPFFWWVFSSNLSYSDRIMWLEFLRKQKINYRNTFVK